MAAAWPAAWMAGGATLIAGAGAVWWLLRRRSCQDEAALLQDSCGPTPYPWPLFYIGKHTVFALQRLLRAVIPPPLYVADVAQGYQRAQLVCAASALGIADALANGPLDAAGLAAAIGARIPEDVERLMSGLLSLGIFQHTRGTPTRYSNNAQSATLRVCHPNSIKGLVEHWACDLYPVFGRLEETIRDGSEDLTAWERVHGRGESLWTLCSRDPISDRRLSSAMRSLNRLFGPALAADGPFRGLTRLVDIGGNAGHFLAQVLRLHPSLTGAVADMSAVLDRVAAPAWAPGGPFADLADRVELLPIDFFDAATLPDIRAGEAVLMSLILHDWPDDKALMILKNLRTRMAPGSTLLLCETALPERSVVDPVTSMYLADLTMHLLFTSRERTPSQWRTLLHAGGFRLVRIHATRSPLNYYEATPTEAPILAPE